MKRELCAIVVLVSAIGGCATQQLREESETPTVETNREVRAILREQKLTQRVEMQSRLCDLARSGKIDSSEARKIRVKLEDIDWWLDYNPSPAQEMLPFAIFNPYDPKSSTPSFR
jgi:hypothetical protein